MIHLIGPPSRERKLAATNLVWWSQPRGDAGQLEPGQPFVVDRVQDGRLYFQNQAAPFDPGKHADKLQVATPRQIELASGDPILIRRNAKNHGLVNGEVLTCTRIQPDGSILTREGKTIPASFRAFSHGYVVTSYKSQGRTHDHVVIAAEQMDAKAAYVACSRGRSQASVFTPDKARLFERVEQSGDRLAVSDVLDPVALRPAHLASTGTKGLAAGRRTGFAVAQDLRKTRTRNRAGTRDPPSGETDLMAGTASAIIGTGNQSMSIQLDELTGTQ